jgi:starch phosphorylase
MAHLAIVGSHKVNGVAELHARIMKETIFRDFDALYPDRIIGITNGITPRRWLHQANRPLAELVTRHLGRDWLIRLEELEALRPLAEDAGFRADFAAAKRANKERLARVIRMRVGAEVPLDSLFDVHVKRIHEYKRQLLNLLGVIADYNRLRAGDDEGIAPRTVIFAGKAAPGYFLAKLVIQLIHGVAEVVNHDPTSRDRLRVVFVPNYDVSSAGVIIPAAELSQQISTAGTEASGTGNMKLALNGALTLGTLDGANVEIRDAVGADNMFIFGLTADAVAARRREGYDPWAHVREEPALREALDMIAGGFFSEGDRERFQPLVDSLTHGGDRYLVLADFAAYRAARRQADALYADPGEWTRRAVLNVAGMGPFSSDRTVAQYAERIWGVSPVHHE